LDSTETTRGFQSCQSIHTLQFTHSSNNQLKFMVMPCWDVSRTQKCKCATPHHTDFLNSLERRWGIPSHRDGHRDPVSSVRRRGAAVVRVRDKEGARRALLPASRVIRHARRNFACKPIEGAHGQRGQIISAGRRVLVEGLSQQVHVASCDQATNCWRNSACGLYIGTIRSTPVRGLRKGPSLFGPFLKASMVGFTLVTL